MYEMHEECYPIIGKTGESFFFVNERIHIPIDSRELPPGFSIEIGDEILVLTPDGQNHIGHVVGTGFVSGPDRRYDGEVVVEGFRDKRFPPGCPVIVNKYF